MRREVTCEPQQHKQESLVSLSRSYQVDHLEPVWLYKHGTQQHPLLFKFLKQTLLQIAPNNNHNIQILRIRTRLVSNNSNEYLLLQISLHRINAYSLFSSSKIPAFPISFGLESCYSNMEGGIPYVLVGTVHISLNGGRT